MDDSWTYVLTADDGTGLCAHFQPLILYTAHTFCVIFKYPWWSHQGLCRRWRG